MHVTAERSEPVGIENHASSDGLGEVGSISTEMHVTPAERSEPGDIASCGE